MDDYFAKVWVISLRRTPGRLADFRRNFPRDWPYLQPEIWPAWDGKTLRPPDDWFPQDIFRSTEAARLGAYGCWQSHLGILRHFILNGLTFGNKPLLVFEDDAVVEKPEQIKPYLDSLPGDWQIAYLGCQHEAPCTSVNQDIVRCLGPGRTHAMIIRPAFVPALIDIWERHGQHVDWTLRQRGLNHRFYAPKVPIAVQGENKSTIIEANEKRRDWSFVPLISDLNFIHSGKFGDLVHCLPVIRQAGGGHLLLTPAAYTGMTMNQSHAAALRPLLEIQPYIKSVEFCANAPVNSLDLNVWRKAPFAGKNISQWALSKFSMDAACANAPWIAVDRPDRKAAVIVNRSASYHGLNFPWWRVQKKYRDRLFVGTRPDWRAFCKDFGRIPHYEPSNFLELARVIAGCDLFIGNQSAPLALAQAMKKRCVVEVSTTHDNCRFDGPGAIYVANGEGFELPNSDGAAAPVRARPRVKHLPGVTLIGIDTNHPRLGLLSLQKSLRQLRFGSAIFFNSAIEQAGIIDCRIIAPFRTSEDYSRFIFSPEISDALQTDFALITHWDGWVLDGSRWRDEFLEYDYVGAPWPKSLGTAHPVGNGGFSLRSRRLLKAIASMRPAKMHPEDIAICCELRPALEAKGMRFAPEDLAYRFAFECGEKPPVEPLGFHGAFNFDRFGVSCPDLSAVAG